MSISLGDGWEDLHSDLPFLVRFGIRTWLIQNVFEDVWFTQSNRDFFNVVLPAGDF